MSVGALIAICTQSAAPMHGKANFCLRQVHGMPKDFPNFF